MTELESFFSLATVIHWLVPNFAWIATPLSKNLIQDQPFYFDDLNATEVQAQSTIQS